MWIIYGMLLAGREEPLPGAGRLSLPWGYWRGDAPATRGGIENRMVGWGCGGERERARERERRKRERESEKSERRESRVRGAGRKAIDIVTVIIRHPSRRQILVWLFILSIYDASCWRHRMKSISFETPLLHRWHKRTAKLELLYRPLMHLEIPIWTPATSQRTTRQNAIKFFPMRSESPLIMPNNERPTRLIAFAWEEEEEEEVI